MRQWRWDPLGSDATYAAVLAHEFNLIVPENAMKWDATEPERGVINFEGGDALVQYFFCLITR